MKQRIAFIGLLLLVLPPVAAGQDRDDQAANVNSRYGVESVSLSGVGDSAISKALRADMQQLVGRNYDQAAVDDLASRLRKELRDYAIDVKVRRGDQAEHVKITFAAERHRNRRFDVHLPPVVYYSGEGWSGAIDLNFDTHHNFFSFGLLDTADELLERNAGYRLRYEHRRVGTDAVQIGVEFDAYHPTFEPPTQTALETAPVVPGAYRRRENFAPSVSVLPLGALKLTAGVSLETLDVELPAAHTERAYAFTADAQFRQRMGTAGGYRHTIGADYDLRRATPALGGDFVYTRHLVSADYTLSADRHLFGVHVKLGHLDGPAPLFDRFLLGNSATLRGWDKFDVAPLGGSRLAYGSLEYRYRQFQIFYDVGSVWDPARRRQSGTASASG